MRSRVTPGPIAYKVSAFSNSTPPPPGQRYSQPAVVQLESKQDSALPAAGMNRRNPGSKTDAGSLQRRPINRHEIIRHGFRRRFGAMATIAASQVETQIAVRAMRHTSARSRGPYGLHARRDGQGAVVLLGEIADQWRSDGNVAGEILQASLDSLSAHVVILDKTGAIAAANVAWQRFATANGLTGYPIGCRELSASLRLLAEVLPADTCDPGGARIGPLGTS